MVEIYIEEGPCSYDVNALVKNFYPNQNIYNKEPGTFVLKMEKNAEGDNEEIIRICISYDEEKICTSIYHGEEMTEQAECTITEDETFKNQIKKFIYGLLSKDTNKILDWGTLTGVRPSKIAMAAIEEGADYEEVKRQMQSHYLCSEEKASLAYTVAKKESELLKKIDCQNGYSIYIGIPFCPTTCLYCSFTSYSAKKMAGHVDAYLDALMKEMDFSKSCMPEKKLTTIYVGGGTPTALNEAQLERLLKKIRETYDFTHVVEFTVEAGRPDSITREKLRLLKQYGVDRISINPQTMKDETLVTIGRSHTIAQVKEAFIMAREEGHDNINMDLIAGLPGETLQDIKDTLFEIQKLNPDSITMHSLVTKRAARLHTGDHVDIPQNVDEMTDYALAFAKENGYAPYYMYRQKNAQGTGTGANQENIGYAREGKEGIYNILIMEEKQSILALGAGASSKIVYPEEGRIERVENVKSLLDYINRIDEMIERKKKFM